MVTVSSQAVDQWFVRQGSKIRGPFSLAVLVSMKERGRLDATTQVSSDRLHWVAAQRLPELFGECAGDAAAGAQQPSAIVPDLQMPASPAESQALGLAGAIDPSLKCFYSVDGIVHGPVPLGVLCQRAANAQLAPTDYVWIEGTSDWAPARSILGLSIISQQPSAISFIRSNAVMVSCIACMTLLVVGLPTWYVFASSRHRQEEAAAQAQAEKDLQQRKEAEKEKGIARLERERDRLFAQERSLISERNQAQMQLETVRLSCTQARADKMPDERLEARMDELGLQLTKFDRDLADVRSAQGRNQQELERQISLLQRQPEDEAMQRQRDAQLAHERELTVQRNQLKTELAQIELARIGAQQRRAELEQRRAELEQQRAQLAKQKESDQAENRSDQANVGARVAGGGIYLGQRILGGWRGVIVQKINNSFYRVKIDQDFSDTYVVGRSYEISRKEFEFLDD